MARLVYSLIVALDGYVNDRSGTFRWAQPDEEVHAAVNELERPIGTYLYGRRLYETMAAWETEPAFAEHDPVLADYAAIWTAAAKIVYSTTLAAPVTSNTRVERVFDPFVIRTLKEQATADLAIGGPTLAAHALHADLVDDIRLFTVPALVGGGTPAFPDDIRLDLDLTDQRRFGNGTVMTQYAVRH